MLENLITLGYIFGVIGFVGCVASYFVFPKLMRFLFDNSEQDDK